MRVYADLGFTQVELRGMIVFSGMSNAEGVMPNNELPERDANFADSPLQFIVKAAEKNDVTIELESHW